MYSLPAKLMVRALPKQDQLSIWEQSVEIMIVSSLKTKIQLLKVKTLRQNCNERETNCNWCPWINKFH